MHRSPLASGLLSGKYNAGTIPADSRFAVAQGDFSWRTKLTGAQGGELLAKLRALAEVAAALGCTMAQLAIAWCLVNPHCTTVILGASRVEQLRENLAALALVPRLTADVMARVDTLLGNKPEAERVWR